MHPTVQASHRRQAREFLEAIQDEADIGGLHYAPCFRDCLGDNMGWVQMRVAELIARLSTDGQGAKV
jgi:hypothetical protein